MLRAIDWYQRGAEGRPSPCRFFPSCSEYGREAIEVHGAGRGLWLTVRRLARCRPFGPSGFDPVPLPCDPLPHDPQCEASRPHATHPDHAGDRHPAQQSDLTDLSDLSDHPRPARAQAHAAVKEA